MVDMWFDLGANNLCSLCFKVPKFVLPPLHHYLKNHLEVAEIFAPKKDMRVDHGANILCYFALKFQNFCFLP